MHHLSEIGLIVAFRGPIGRGFPKCITHRLGPRLSIARLNESRLEFFKNRFQFRRIVHGPNISFVNLHVNPPRRA
jgi:hypothetical protein